MARKEHIQPLIGAIASMSMAPWNHWRIENPNILPDLLDVELADVNLSFADLSHADLSRTNLHHATLQHTDLSSTSLQKADHSLPAESELGLAASHGLARSCDPASLSPLKHYESEERKRARQR